MNKLKGILIDSTARTVTEVEIEPGLQAIYDAVKCDTIDAITPQRTLRSGDCIFVDDEGLLKDPQNFFLIGGYPQHLAGNGLILGTDGDGDSVDAATPLEHVLKCVTFYHIQDLRKAGF